MPLDYTLLSLPCWSCNETFQHFTDLSNHHLAHHEQLLNGEPVDAWLARSVLSEDCHICGHDPFLERVCSRCGPKFAACLEARCTCGCVYAAHRGITAELPLQPCGDCACRAFVLALKQETPVPIPAPEPQWMWQASSGGIHDYAHIETPGCGEVGCVPIRMGTAP